MSSLSSAPTLTANRTANRTAGGATGLGNIATNGAADYYLDSSDGSPRSGGSLEAHLSPADWHAAVAAREALAAAGASRELAADRAAELAIAQRTVEIILNGRMWSKFMNDDDDVF